MAPFVNFEIGGTLFVRNSTTHFTLLNMEGEISREIVNTYCRLQKHVGPIMEFLAEIQECAWLVYNAPLSLIVRPVPEA